jgi:hypothetical protein
MMAISIMTRSIIKLTIMTLNNTKMRHSKMALIAYAECYADCDLGMLILLRSSVIMLSDLMLSVVMPRVGAKISEAKDEGQVK